MLSETQREHVTRATRTMQIITVAIVGGLLFFLAIVLILAAQNEGKPAEEPLITYTGVAFALAAIAAWAIVPRALIGRMRQSIVEGNPNPRPMRVPNAAELGDVLPLTGAFQTKLVLGCAVLEGAAFLCLVAYMIERQPLSLVITGVLVLLMLSQIPTLSRVESWVEGEITTIEQLRLLRKM